MLTLVLKVPIDAFNVSEIGEREIAQIVGRLVQVVGYHKWAVESVVAE